MTEKDIKAIALFFYFGFLDDKKAIEAAAQALNICADRLKLNPQADRHRLVVSATQEIWDRYQQKLVRGRPQLSPDSGWLVPEGVDMGPWKEFQKNSTQDELLTVIWSQILGFSDAEISVALGITEGTVRYRLGRALRKLGTIAQPVRVRHV